MDSTWIDLSSTITIVVANTGTEYVVHKHVVCEASPFVTACLKEHTKEAREQKIEVQEWDDDDSMRILIVWMYQGKSILRISASLLNGLNTRPSERVGALQVRLTKLYLLADRFLMLELKNNIIDCISDLNIFYPKSITATRMLFETGPPQCKLKSYLTWSIAIVVEYMCKNPDQWSEKERQEYQQETDMPFAAHAILRLLVEGVPEWKGICDYHEHGADNSAKRCGNSSEWVEIEDDVAIDNEAMDNETGNAKDQGPAK